MVVPLKMRSLNCTVYCGSSAELDLPTGFHTTFIDVGVSDTSSGGITPSGAENQKKIVVMTIF